MKKINFTQTQVIAAGFAVIILVGTLLLMLPFSTREGLETTFLGALLTATSSTCVTGLIAYDTYGHWTVFGQCVILAMIQIGGLGFMTFNVMFLQIFRKNIGLKTRGLVKESVNAMQYGGVVKLVRLIFKGSLIIEAAGAVLLSIRFIPMFGAVEGIYNAVFHSVSAFCNAGFDLMGRFGEFGSLTGFVGDGLVNFTICALIIIGGLGFIVWDDILHKGYHIKKYRLHTKMVLLTTSVLLVGATVMFLLLENGNTLRGLGTSGKLYGAVFDAVTPRTAGFNTTDTAALSNGGKLLTMFLMFIGGSPGSTAGGIKTTTLLVIIVYVFSNLRNSQGCNIFGRRLEDDTIKKASLVVFINMSLAVLASCIICGIQENLPMPDVLFEVFSAIGTAGMSTGITREMAPLSSIVIIVLMYAGRIGSMTFGMSFLEKKRKTPVKYPVEKITIG